MKLPLTMKKKSAIPVDLSALPTGGTIVRLVNNRWLTMLRNTKTSSYTAAVRYRRKWKEKRSGERGLHAFLLAFYNSE